MVCVLQVHWAKRHTHLLSLKFRVCCCSDVQKVAECHFYMYTHHISALFWDFSSMYGYYSVGIQMIKLIIRDERVMIQRLVAVLRTKAKANQKLGRCYEFSKWRFAMGFA